MSVTPEEPAIRPFTVEIPEAELEALRACIAATRWLEKETVADQSQAVQLTTMQELARYWASDYDWRKCEAKLNALPQFMTEIDRLDIHFILMMGTHPQTLTGLADSPVGMAAFMLDHDAHSLELISQAFAGHPGGLTRDDVLDNITLFWLTNTAISAARLYWENKFAYFAVKGVSIPVAVSVFPDELYQAPQSWAEQAYPNLIHCNKLDKGGHFAAWEQPQLFAEELRASFRSLR